MQLGDIPAIFGNSHSHSTFNPVTTGCGLAAQQANNVLKHYAAQAAPDAAVEFLREKVKMAVQTTPARRFVKVIIIDPDSRVDLDQCVLYNGSEKLTDLTDQELFFELDIKSMLDTYNATRTKIIDKLVKDRTEYLPPVKVRDLKMVVTTIASF